MSVLRTVKSSEISEFARDIKACKNNEDKLFVLVKYYHLMEIDTHALNNIPDVIQTTDEIGNPIGALTNHIRKVVKRCSREAPAPVDRRKLPADALDLLRAKNVALRNAYVYSTRKNRSKARSLLICVRARMLEVRNEEWNNLIVNLRERSLGAETVSGLGVQTAGSPEYIAGTDPRSLTVAARHSLRGTPHTRTRAESDTTEHGSKEH
ncbi:hypothetical protein EVAR_14216_1 [Eumeta japonica]|uniref:Uncharacterized protein n=1 Tax=Eumeta variegata TaxID=151549 RepID=A0A4C1UFX8_EUMVA|nr:hypothetical protein EVAR_14216_1 [Eumeta japonica]